MKEHDYFRAIEAHFIELRGAPLLLTPADYQVARGWWVEGIPLNMVRQTLTELFDAREKREDDRKVHTLKYCASSVEKAWKRIRDHEHTGRRQEVIPMNTRARLTSLADAIPASLDAAEALREAVTSLEGSAESVESALALLDSQLLESAHRSLEPAEEERLEATLEESLRRLETHLGSGEVESARERLRERALRRQLGLPTLSLFGSSR